MVSLWHENNKIPSFEPLREKATTDVLIIGGGMAGILCARLLHDAGADCLLVEADRLCGGVTGDTTAKITSQHGLIYDTLIRRFGTKKAWLYLQSHEQAIRRYRELAKSIDCRLESKDAYVYSCGNPEALNRESEALRKLGFRAEITRSTVLPFPIAGAIRFRRQAQFDPLAFAAGIIRGLSIAEHTPIRRLEGTVGITDTGRITAKHVIIATHFPFLNQHGAYFLKLYQQRSYVLALSDASEVRGMYIDAAPNGLSFRNADNLLLLGGGGHRTGKQGGGWQELTRAAREWYPKAQEVCRWATQDCMSLDGLPYIGRYSPHLDNIYVATGFNKWGMTSSLVAASLLCDLVQGKRNPYTALYDPARTILRPQLAINAASAVTHLLTPTTPRCPHLGCALTYNRQEHSWDCPCHGSRFSANGTLINNPATENLKHRPPAGKE